MTMYQKSQLDQLEKQKKTGRNMLLATVAITALNLALMFANSNFSVPYNVSLSYYLTVLGYLFDGYTFATYTRTGLVMAAAVLILWLLVWYCSKGRKKWLLAGMALAIADTLFLVVFAFLFLSSPSSCLIECVIHIAVIYEIWQAYAAYSREDRLKESIALEEARQAMSADTEEATEAETEYSDILA